MIKSNNKREGTFLRLCEIEAEDNYSKCNKRIKAVQKQRQIILSQDRSGGLQCGNRWSEYEESSGGAYVQIYEEVGRIIYRQYSLVIWVLMAFETATRTCIPKWLSRRANHKKLVNLFTQNSRKITENNVGQTSFRITLPL